MEKIKMKSFTVIIAVFLDFAVLVIGMMDFSSFKVTKVLYETCPRSKPLSVFVYKRPILCALECSKNKDCRRMMVCTHSTADECSLYYEGENCGTGQTTGCSCYMKTYGKVNNTVVCPLGLYGDNCENTIIDCSEGNDRGLGVFSSWVRSYIKPMRSTTALEVLCYFGHGGYTFFMNRIIHCPGISFNKNITEYIHGFGDPNGEHWLGLNTLKQILDNHPRNMLTVILINDDYCENYYDDFSIGTVAEGYAIHTGLYQTWPGRKCGDSLTGAVNIDGSFFSAPGSDHTSFNCADTRQGGWWYVNDSRCSESDFTGSIDAMLWPTSLGSVPQKTVSLRVKPYHK